MDLLMDLTPRCPVEELRDRLTDVYRCFQTRSCPAQSAAEVASVIHCGVGLLVAGGETVPSENHLALTCNALSLLEKMTSSLTPHDVSASYFTEVLRLLFQNLNVMSQLMDLFHTEEQIISHLAAKSASASVIYHVHKADAVSPVWLQTCVQAFLGSPPGPTLDACLWSLTDVMKRLLRGALHGILDELVAAVDSSLCSLCSKFLTDKPMQTPPLGFTRDQRWTVTFCLLLDLLEVLTASGLTPGSTARLCQRLSHLNFSALLSTSGGFVRKRALLLLKRAALQKAGEDWALGETPSIGPKHEYLTSDMSLMAEAVLAAVAADWLNSVEATPASFFGGTRNVRYDEGQKPDCVMLRSVSLLLLKSMELHLQTAAGTADGGGALEPCGHLQRLWCFLKQSSVWLSGSSHLCCLVSVVFEEQDDDMMEAAKALLFIFLNHRQGSSLDTSEVLEEACASGCNPHCHFLFLLQSVSFDHSILLDFLISTETCFLEYFVRYLKFLTTDWPGFAAACGRIRTSDPHRWSQTSPSGASPCVTGPRLVEYESSEDSDEEVEISQGDPETPVLENSQINAFPVGPRMKKTEGLSWQPAQQTCTNSATVSQVTREAVVCLSRLGEVVARLQTKKLFPYNASSLLKLLQQVLRLSQQSQSS